MKTQVGIIGAGPAGLMLSRLLHLNGIESVVIENQSREYIEQRIRAGVLEHGSMEMMNSAGVGARMMREGMQHQGIELRFDGAGHRIDFTELTGRGIMVYGQQQVVRDLVNAHLDERRPLLFSVSAVHLEGINGDRPVIHFVHEGQPVRLECGLIAGCDGFHGVSRPSIPEQAIKIHQHTFPFGWLGILAEAAPSSTELIYAAHQNGFALHSMRTPQRVRNYLQCKPDEDLVNWPDKRIWAELQNRMALKGGFSLNEGRIIEKSVTPMRSYIVEPMQYGNLFLAGDAAHIVPPTGAKGMNLALKDVRVLAEAVIAKYRDADESGLAAYSSICLKHVWRAQYFSWWMTSLLHRFEEHDSFMHGLQRAQLRHITESRSAATLLAENYVGMY